MLNKTTEETGLVYKVEDGKLCILIHKTSACAECHAKNMCSETECNVRTLEFYTDKSSEFSLGDTVKIVGKSSLGLQAVLLAYVVPFLLILAILAIMIAVFGCSELFSSLTALGTVVVYYIVLWFCRNALSRHFLYHIEKENP